MSLFFMYFPTNEPKNEGEAEEFSVFDMVFVLAILLLELGIVCVCVCVCVCVPLYTAKNLVLYLLNSCMKIVLKPLLVSHT